MKRRAVVAGVGAVAVLLGIGTALRRGGNADDDSASVALWDRTLQRPDGTPLRFADLRGKPLLVNFWATWCPPCVTEMPLLAGFHREQKNWNVVAIAVDQADPVRAFIVEHRIELPIVLGGADGLQLARTLGNTAGGLPFSVACAAGGRVAGRKLGTLDDVLLSRWAADVH